MSVLECMQRLREEHCCAWDNDDGSITTNSLSDARHLGCHNTWRTLTTADRRWQGAGADLEVSPGRI